MAHLSFDWTRPAAQETLPMLQTNGTGHSNFRATALTGMRRRLAALAGAGLIAFAVFGDVAEARTPPDSFADLAEKLLPAVVNISTTQKVDSAAQQNRQGREGMPQFPPGSPFEEFFKDFFERQQRGGNRPSRPVTSLGSGFVIDASGIVLTNNHVIADADEVKVIFSDDTEVPAKIVGRDPKTDLAVLKIETRRNLVAVPWGDSERVRVGDWVLAIGNPFGLGGTVTAGIISARGRNIRSGPYDDFFQTDAPINKGNSGGPLFNMAGEVIGMNTAIYSQSGGSIGIGFSTPANLLKPVVEQIIKFGKPKRGWLGVRIQSVTEEIAESLGLDRPRGALIAGVTENGPAEKAKIEAGDVVLTFDGKPINNMNALPRVVAETSVGKTVDVEVWRKNRSQKLRVAVGELDEDETKVAAATSGRPTPGAQRADRNVDALGLKLAGISPELRQRFNLKDDVKGVVVTEVTPDSPAAKADLRPGDVIVEVAQSEVKSPEEVAGKVKEQQDAKKRTVLLMVDRAGNQSFIGVVLGRG
jgi:serine protease Do